jgi:hypothetical protein
MLFNKVTQILHFMREIRKYVYTIFSRAFSSTYLLLKENAYFIRDIKFCMTYTYII